MKKMNLFEFIESDVVKGIESRLKSLDKEDRHREGTQGFVFEDSQGNLIRVFVDEDQADDFSKALASVMNDDNDQRREIAEILYDLKGHFDIRDVEWPKDAIPEDEEVEPNPEESTDEVEGEPTDEDSKEDEGIDPLDQELDNFDGGDETAEATDLLSKLIGMMQADVESKTAEAKARRAEAEAKIATSAKTISKQRAEEEEMVLDMERYEKEQKQKKEEEELRKRLIKYKHAVKNKKGDGAMKVNENLQDIEISPEEEEILDMEDWEKRQKELKKKESMKERLARYRHAKKKQQQQKREEEETKLKSILKKAGVMESNVRDLTFQAFLEATKK